MSNQGFNKAMSEFDFASLKKGKHKGFNAAYSLYADHVYSLCFHIVGNEQVSADILQTVFETVLNKHRSLKSVESFGFWLRKCAINECMKYFRQTKRDNIFLNNPLHKDREAHETEQENKANVDSALKDLPSLSRSVVYLHTVKDLKHSEIAPNLGIKEANSRKVHSRAIKQMRSILKKQGGGNNE